MSSVMSEGFKARDIGLRAQKKILGRMAANKNTRKIFIDDNTASLLDNLFKMIRLYTDNKKEAEKLVKHIIKTVIKIGVLYRNDELNAADMACAERFKNKFHAAAMAVLSFHEVDFTYDRQYLLSALQEAHANLRQLVQNHLKEKSLQRIDSVFLFFTNPNFLDAVFQRNSEYKEILDKMVEDINYAMDEKHL
uniref:Tumor necrosis factor alpha-induced protein 8-like protein n=1 Tax=Cuerna arida TaxID=1464854 RepID=A0A1B6ESN0_9HEMI